MKNFKYAKNFLARIAPLDNEAGTKVPIEKVFQFVMTSINHTSEGGYAAPMISSALKAVLTRLDRQETMNKLLGLLVPVRYEMDLMDRLVFVLKYLPFQKDDEAEKIKDVLGKKQMDILMRVYYT